MAITSDVSDALIRLAKNSGLARGELSRRFHRIKQRGQTPGPADTNFIDDDSGDVYDGPNDQPGQYIGNVFDDF
jgi:hypothetical protein